MGGHGAKLPRKKEAAAAALLTQRTVEDAAQSVEIGPATLRRWQKEPEFQTTYRAAKSAAYPQSVARLRQMSTAGFDFGESDGRPEHPGRHKGSRCRQHLEPHNQGDRNRKSGSAPHGVGAGGCLTWGRSSIVKALIRRLRRLKDARPSVEASQALAELIRARRQRLEASGHPIERLPR